MSARAARHPGLPPVQAPSLLPTRSGHGTESQSGKVRAFSLEILIHPYRLERIGWEGVILDLVNSLAVLLLLGGIWIGAASGLLTLLTGRVMSATQMIGSLLGGAEGVAATSIAFIGGILVAPLLMTALGFSSQPSVEPGWPFLIAGGLMIGVAARWGGASLLGAVTGMAQRAPRSAAIFLTILGGAVLGGGLYLVVGWGGIA